MKWGPAFADLCYTKKVKLVNYPAGMKPIGPHDGIPGAAHVPLQFMKSIVGQYVRYWKQEARAIKADAAKEGDAKDDDKDKDSDGEDEDLVLESDLTRFVPWADGELSGSIVYQN